MFVPEDFQVPEKLETDKFKLRMLTVNDVVKDYDAVMTSLDHLKDTFGPLFPGWPSPEMTLEEDLSNLGWHQTEFQFRRSFTYTVVTLDESKVIGCVYIFPPEKKTYDAEVFMWMRESKKDLDSELFSTVSNWINDKWPFENVGYPGRKISWEEWEKLN